MQVSPSAADDLDVHAGGLRVVALHSVHAEVVRAVVRVLRVDQGQGDEGSAVLLPGLEHRQPVEASRSVHDVEDRPPGHTPKPHSEGIGDPIPLFPDGSQGGGEEVLRDPGCALDELDRLPAECELHPPGCPEEVRDQRKVGLDALVMRLREDQRGPAGGDDAAVDLGGFEVGVDRHVDLDHIAAVAQQLEEDAEISWRHAPA